MRTAAAGLTVMLVLVLSACSSDQPGSGTSGETAATRSEGMDPTQFFEGALTEDVATADCTLTGGTVTSCYTLTVAGFPANRDSIGPWCPKTTSGSADTGGIWFDGEAVYDIDGQFILDLATIYDDPTWKLYDEDGNVLSTDTSEKFNDLVTGGPQDEADAGPVNLCVYGEIEWVDGGGPITSTVEIPITPTKAESPAAAGTILGVTLDGVRIDNSAPMDLILGNYTIGAFDPCGGHTNPQEGYHMHATTGCSGSAQAVPDGETALFGYALDGYAIHEPYDDAGSGANLDECNGHETAESGYHYHANEVAKNAVLTCFSGETTASADEGPGNGGPGGAGPAGGGPGGG